MNILKGGELKARQAHDEKVLTDVFKDFYTGFLTDKEIKEVIADKDMWMGTEEVLSRWERRKAITTSAQPTPTTSTTPARRGRPKKA